MDMEVGLVNLGGRKTAAASSSFHFVGRRWKICNRQSTGKSRAEERSAATL